MPDDPSHRRADDSLLEQHIKDEQERYQELHTDLEEIKSLLSDVSGAFLVDPVTKKPDYSGHAEAHQAWIDAQRARKDFYNKLQFELAKWGLLGFLGWLLVSVIWPAIVKGHV